MIDIRLRVQNEVFHLGDAILTCTVLAAFKNVRIHSINPSKGGIQLVARLSNTIYSNHYNFEIVQLKDDTKCAHIWPDVYYLEHNLTTIEPNKNIIQPINSEPYITTQISSTSSMRNVNERQIAQYLPKLKRIDLSQAPKNQFVEIFNVVGNAQQHIGSLSGIAWVAMSTNTPMILLQPKTYRQKKTPKMFNRLLECMYRHPLTTIYDV